MQQARLPGGRLVVVDVAEAYVSVDAKAERGRGGEAAEDAVAVDGFAAPRPRFLVDNVVVDHELQQPLADALRALTNQRRVADETALLLSLTTRLPKVIYEQTTSQGRAADFSRERI